MFRMSYNRTAPLPSFANWDVSHVTSARGCFVMFNSEYGSCIAEEINSCYCPVNESLQIVALDLTGWNLQNGCEATGLFSYVSDDAEMYLEVPSPINAIFCENTWDITSENGVVFLGLDNLRPVAAHEYSQDAIGPEMACPGPAGYFDDPSTIS